NSRIANAIRVKRTNGQWQSYSINNFSNNPSDNSYTKMQIDRNGTKWFASHREGVFGFNENMTPAFRKVTVENQQGFPFTDTRALAIDNRNQLWIGSLGGLRVMPSIDRFMNDGDLVSRPIIIVEDGIAQELLADQYITAIVVDGANNKWIGTADAGVFQVSPNGQQTLNRFTETNSPLPSNSIRDIDINGVTGEVFFVTDRGMVSFRGTATDGSRNFNDVVVYPNPVRPGYTGTVKITGLVDRANVKITDIEGNLVHEQTAAGGTIEWDTTAFGKYKVASGVYMIFLSTEDGMETKVKKVMIVR
ncbi:MAG: T9SS type A sorting domain-containing protein, partial [Flavobacterium sp.]